MTPYYERDGIRLFLGDCRDVLPTLARDSVDLIVADPPYGIAHKTKGGSRRSLHPAKGGVPPRNDWPVIAGDDEPFDPSHLLAYPRVVLFGANHYSDRLPPSSAWLVWDKREGGTSDRSADCELAWTNLDGPARLYSQLWRGMIMRGDENGTQRLHPNQKPIALMRWIIERWTQPGDLILDPYAGSGTTLAAAVQTGRRCIGVEISETYCEVIARRLEQMPLPLLGVGA